MAVIRLLGPIAFLLSSYSALAQTPITVDEARATALDFADVLEEGYMDPAIGARYAAMLRANAENGAYDGFSDAEQYAVAVTADVQAVGADAHIRLRLRDDGEAANGARQRSGGDRPAFNPIGETKWIEDGIAYSEWFAFMGADEAMAHVENLMRDYAGAEAIIFDIRQHRGGALSEMDFIFQHLFAEPTHLLTMKIRAGKGERMAAMFDAEDSLRRQPQKDGVNSWEHWTLQSDEDLGWADVPVYVLTSGRAASAAEHFSLALKTTGRATLIGEATRGAGHFGGDAPVGERFVSFIPVGETIDPKTGKGWEGVGVKPDIEVAPDEALETALRLIRGE